MAVSFSKAQLNVVKTIIRTTLASEDHGGLTKTEQRSLRIAYGKILDKERQARDRAPMLEQRARDRRDMIMAPSADAATWRPGDPIYRPGT